VFLLQNPLNLSVSTTLNTYIYSVGIVGGQFSYSTAVGVFNSVIAIILVVIFNTISRKVNETSLW
jgi:putative aldouronate transport system permease protein